MQVFFVESICDDPQIILENIKVCIMHYVLISCVSPLRHVAESPVACALHALCGVCTYMCIYVCIIYAVHSM